MLKRAAFLLTVVVGLAAWPVFGFDYTHWRTDGVQLRGSSVGQQASNAAFNMFDSLMDAASSSFALFWVGELQENGGVTTPPFGDSPPTVAVRDNRIQEPDVDWETWRVVTDKTIAMPRPSFSPNIPQAWNPIVVDLEQGLGQADHLLASVSFEPPTVGGVNDFREQILNIYYPQTATGLPGNATSVAPADRGVVRPLWVRANGKPGLRLRDLAPLSGSDLLSRPGTGIVTQPPIFARVPATYIAGGQVVSEVLPVVILVIGTGENMGTSAAPEPDSAKIVCLTLQQPRGTNPAPPDNTWLPNPVNADPSVPYPTFPPPDPSMFDPATGSGGAVLWSYTVENRAGNGPTPVAGISFANFGDSSDSRPTLFVTTGDGQILALNAKGADRDDFTVDGDPVAGAVRWRFETSTRTPDTTGVAETPGFLYGMAPAVARVPLNGMFGSPAPAAPDPRANTINNALTRHAVSEWMLFVADTYGTFWGFDAPGVGRLTGGQISSYDPQIRWRVDPPNTTAILNPPAGRTDFRRDLLNGRARFLAPPVVYQGGTPMTRANGSLLSGSSDVGLDDAVIFTEERGRIYAYDALGKLRVGGADDGRPEFLAVNNPATESGTDLRWQWPDNDTQMLPPPGTNGAVEPQVWPRELPDVTIQTPANPDPNNPQLIERLLGKATRDLRGGAPPGTDGQNANPAAQYDVIFQRAAIGTALGGNSDPNGAIPNQDVGDDVLLIPYQVNMGPDPAPPPAPRGTPLIARPRREIYEYYGSMKPYGFVQMSRPVLQVDRVTAIIGGTRFDMPLNHIRVGVVKSNGLSSNQSPTLLAEGGAPNSGGANPFYQLGAPPVEDTVYIVDPTWYDTGSNSWVRLRLGQDRVEVEYRPPASLGSQTLGAAVTENLSYPSCFRGVIGDPDLERGPEAQQADPNDPLNTVIVRSRATLSEQNTRLEQTLAVRNDPAVGPGQRRGFFIGRGNGVNRDRWNLNDEAPAQVVADLWDNFSYRPPAPMAAGSASLGGTVLAPAMFRGRILAYDQKLSFQRGILGKYDPRLDPTVRLNFAVGPPTPVAGPPLYYGPSPTNRYDPGLFYDPDGNAANGRESGTPDYTDEIFEASDPGASVTILDGWLYVTHRNGHTRGYSVAGGGASGTVGGNPPLFQPPGSTQNTGNTVRAPSNILIMNGPDPAAGFRSWAGDEPVLLEWGETVYLLVDFGPEGNLVPPQSLTTPDLNFVGSGLIDAQVLQNQVRGQIRSSNGAVQQLAGANQGVMPAIIDIPSLGGRRVAAIIPVFAGIPSPSNPLTPGTPLLWERQPSVPNNDFDGEVTFDLQIVQQGLQWYWTPAAPPPSGGLDPASIHFWEAERNQTAPGGGQSVRFLNTGGTAGAIPGGPRQWYPNPAQPISSPANIATAQWAPLVSYNNPILIAYTPAPGAAGMLGAGGGVNVIPSNNAGAPMARYTDRRQQGRKNGDQYAEPLVVDGSRSGAGRPVAPVIGQPIVNGSARQLLFGEHGRATPTSTTAVPELAVLRVADRSLLAQAGRELPLRVQRAPLTKIGKGALYGSGGDAALLNAGGAAAPAGSFEQNAAYWDDGPDQQYPSISDNRLRVLRYGTQLDLASSVTTVPGRVQNGAVWQLPDFTNTSQVERLAVQIDIPPYTPDDIYSTRWRSSTTIGTKSGAPPASAFNPFFPGPALFGDPARPLWDRAERRGRGPAAGVPDPAPGEDLGPNALETINPEADDRFRRVMLFNDANGNGQLDLLPNYREAYRTFAVQVVVKPEMKLEAGQGFLDLGNLWHGKKQPGLPGAATNDIREYQRMEAALAGQGTPTEQSIAQFYKQYWRPFNLLNTGNVNLAFIKPEVAFEMPNQPPQFVALPGEGNDPWRALTLINLVNNASLIDPTQIFLRTSFDDQLLPDASGPYGSGMRGVWLQKAVVGAGQPGAVLYAHNGASVSANPLARDPSMGGGPRAGWISLNIPTGSPLGQYSGAIRFFNDRGVGFVEDPNIPHGYRYVKPENLPGNGGSPSALDGTLSRRNDGLPIEPASDPPVRIKARVIENLILGRYNVAGGAPDPSERRIQPTAAADLRSSSAAGQVRGLLLGYASNRSGLLQPQPQASNYDIFGSQLLFDVNRLLFPFDELPLDRPPWANLTGAAPGSTALTAVPNGMQATKPTVAQLGTSIPLVAWTQRFSTGTALEYGIVYRPFDSSNAEPVLMWPIGSSSDPVAQLANLRQTKSSVRIQPFLTPGNQPAWFAFYASGQATRRNLVYTFSTNPSLVDTVTDNRWPARWPRQLAVGWTPEVVLPTSRSLSTVNDPFVFNTEQTQRPAVLPAQPGQPPYIQQENQQLPRMTWMSYAGTSQRRGLTDIYLSRFRTASLASQAQRSGGGVIASPDPLRSGEDYGLVTFPRVERDVMRATASRTFFTGRGADWVIRAYSPVQVYMGLPQISSGSGSLGAPINLVAVNQIAPGSSTGELVFPLNPALMAGRGPNDPLRRQRVIVDAAAGIVRLTADSRTLARMIFTGVTFNENSQDPVIFADYTPATLRVSRGDVSASNAVVVPVISIPGQKPVLDASWYRQRIDGNKWTTGEPVAGIADRVWVMWRRQSGAVSGGPSLFYKVLRPGIRLAAGRVRTIDPANLSFNISGGPQVVPEEINPETGQVYFPYSFENQRIVVNRPGNISEYVVTWQEETGEQPVPMETAVNEGSVDAFASFEDVQLTQLGGGPIPGGGRHMEKIWLSWSSTRGTGGDLFYATLAPRIGPDVNVGASVTLFAPSASSFAAMSQPRQRAVLEAAAEAERRRPYTQPPIVRRGPLLQSTGPPRAPRAR